MFGWMTKVYNPGSFGTLLASLARNFRSSQLNMYPKSSAYCCHNRGHRQKVYSCALASSCSAIKSCTDNALSPNEVSSHTSCLTRSLEIAQQDYQSNSRWAWRYQPLACQLPLVIQLLQVHLPDPSLRMAFRESTGRLYMR